MARFTPVGPARDWAVTALRLAVEAIADGNTALAGSILEQVQPESEDNSTTTVAWSASTRTPVAGLVREIVR